MKPAKKKRVYVEDAKARHTTHWDLDYLSLDEIESMRGKKQPGDSAGDRPPKWTRLKILATILIGATAVLLAALVTYLLGA